MALSQRNSRRIIVDGSVFRWVASQNSGFVVFVAQHEENNGKKVEIVVSSDDGLIIEKGSFSVECGGIAELIITPKTAESLIRKAIEIGWNPAVTGPPVELTLNGNELCVRRGL